MKRLIILLMVVLAVGVMAGIVNAQTEVSQDFGVANFAADTSFNSTSVGTHTGTGPTDLGFVASGLCSSGGTPPAHHGVTNNRYEFMHFSSNSGVIQTEAADPTYGVDFGNPRTGYILFDSVDLGGGSSLSMSVGEITGATNTGDDEVVIRVYVNGEPGLGKDIFDTRADGNGELDSGDARGGAIYVEDTVDDMGGILTYDFAPSDTSVILYVAVFTDDDGDGYYIDDIVISSAGTAQLVSPIVWALVDVGLLEWLRPDPIVGTDPYVTVNVRFGTDPNLIVGVNGTLQIETDYNGDSSTNIPATLDLNEEYYWIVDVIDPNGGNGGHFVPGDLWTFVTTIPPAVIVTESDGSTDVSEEGETSDTFTIALSKAPPAPVTVTIGSPTEIVQYILASGDDAEEHQDDGEIGRSSSDLEMPYDGSEEQITGLWFTDIKIPNFATITSATVDFQADGDSSVDVYLTIGGRLDDPGSFQQDINWMISTPGVDDETTAEVEWTPDPWTDNVRYFTPDISAIIQEIIDQPSWSSGNNLAVTIRNGNSGGTTASGERRRAESWNGSSSGGDPRPVLRVTFDPVTQVTLSQNVVV
ncbi:MAG: hypothetical protein V3W44_09125, partial [Dehalococcoidales bacterium]